MHCSSGCWISLRKQLVVDCLPLFLILSSNPNFILTLACIFFFNKREFRSRGISPLFSLPAVFLKEKENFIVAYSRAQKPTCFVTCVWAAGPGRSQLRHSSGGRREKKGKMHDIKHWVAYFINMSCHVCSSKIV